MFSVMATNPLKASKKTSAAANKIRNKILNTSSFFKVSLQTNNRALALALEAQKERSRQLEKEVVLLQKQVEELCFQLASRNYKHRRLLVLLENLQRSTMEQLSSATELLTGSPQTSKDSRTSSTHVSKDGMAPGRIPESQRSIRSTSLSSTEPAVSEQLICYDEGRPEVLAIEASHLCSNLRESVKMLSAAMSQPVLVPQRHPPSKCEDTGPYAASTDEAQTEMSIRPEKTMLLNSSMEMTLCSTADIVTVETKAKKPQRVCKTKEKKTRAETVSGSDYGLKTLKVVPLSPRQQENSEPSSSKAQLIRAAPSRIPKLTSKIQPVEQKGLLPADTDDYFTDRQSISSAERLNFTCRKSRSRPRRTLAVAPPESGQSSPDLCSEEHAQSGCTELDSSSNSCNPESRTSTVTYSRGSHRSRCRSTFVVAVIDAAVSPEKSKVNMEVSQEPPSRRPETRSTGKRSWEASEEPSATSSHQREALTLDETHKQKKARREGAERHDRKTAEKRTKKKGLIKDLNQKKSAPCPHTNEEELLEVCGAPSPRPPQGFLTTLPGSDISHRQQRAREPSITALSRRTFTPPSRSRSVFPEGGEEVMLMDEPPPWLEEASAATPLRETQSWRTEESGRTDEPQKDSTRLDKKTLKKKRMNKGLKPQHDPPPAPDTNEEEQWKAWRSPPPSEGCGSDVSYSVRTHRRPGSWGMDKELPEETMRSNMKAAEQVDQPKRRTKKKGLNKGFQASDEPTCCPTSDTGAQMEACGAPPPGEGLPSSPSKGATLCRRSVASPARSRTVRESFVFYQSEAPLWSEEGSERGADVVMETPQKETRSWRTDMEVTHTSPGRVLTSLTNMLVTPEGEVGGRGRRRHAVVSYKEPPLNSKMRRGDKFTESTFLSSPLFRDVKKKKKQKKEAALTAASH